MRKQLQVKKLQAELFEYEIKLQERYEDIERIKTTIKKQEDLISKIESDINNMGE
jgi:ppGpp synthetase/RelA/SpoT-type nucleotidyltranferase